VIINDENPHPPSSPAFPPAVDRERDIDRDSGKINVQVAQELYAVSPPDRYQSV
jgi:hypothetical protein